jgi:hypothetical protein
MSNYCTTARQGAKNDRDYGARHPILRGSIVLHHGCVLAYGQRAPRAPHRKCRESVAGILTEKSLGDVAPRTRVRTGSYRPRIRAGYVVFFKKLFSDRPPASDSRGALQSLNVRGESAYPNTPDPRRYCLASATSSTTFASRSVRIHLRSFMPAMQFTLCARASWPGRSDAAAYTCTTCFLQSAHW